MSLLDRLKSNAGSPSFDSLGYIKNPFPPRGKVHDEVYAERPELATVEDSLARFLMGESSGRTWAVIGDSGIGKSNFLRHVVNTLERVTADGSITGVAYRYLTSQQLTPRQLAEAIAAAIGLDAFEALFRELASTKYQPSSDIEGTALGDFLTVISKGKQDPHEAGKFVLRWLGGQQTYAPERLNYGIAMRERMPPAVALPWLRYLLDLMAGFNILSRLVLLLDEFEDVQSLGSVLQNDYVMTLKGLINAFNLDSLFLVLAGQPAAFDRLGQRFPSLKTRWDVVVLEPIRKPEEAVKLAQLYMVHEHKQWLISKPAERLKAELEPSEVHIKALFADLISAQPSRVLTQRDLLAGLHDWIETRLRPKTR